MRYFLLLFLFIANYSFAQEVLPSCIFTTDGKGAAQGLKIKFIVPCKWQRSDDKAPVVKTFSSATDSGMVLESIVVKKSKTLLTKAVVDNMLSIDQLKKTEDNETFMWGRRLKIDGKDCGETATKMIKKLPDGILYVHSVRYIFPLKNKILIIGFAVTSKSEVHAQDLFNIHKMLFYQLASNTDFL